MRDTADQMLIDHAERQIAWARERIAALEAEVIALSAASNYASTPLCTCENPCAEKRCVSKYGCIAKVSNGVRG